jgi:hypothetical protein
MLKLSMAGTKEGAAKQRAIRERLKRQASNPQAPPVDAADSPVGAAMGQPSEFVRRDLPPKPEPPPEPEIVIEPSPELISAVMAAQIYGLLGTLEVYGAQKIWGLTPEEARRIFKYSPGELAVLAGPTSAVVNKYANAAVLKYREEIALVLALLYVHREKMAAVQDIFENRQRAAAAAAEATPAPGRTNGVDAEYKAAA